MPLARIPIHGEVSKTNIADRGAFQVQSAHIAQPPLPRLEVLALRGTKVTSNVVPSLQKLPQLKHLYLMGTAVDDFAVPGLLKLRLQSLDIRFTQISAAGQRALKKHVQYCETDALIQP